MADILVVGLNPAWQTVLDFSGFRLGQVNRAESSDSLASGKGINTAKVLARLDHHVTLLQILGGETGRQCLIGCAKLGIRSRHVWVEAETRRCLTLLHGDSNVPGESTEVIEPFWADDSGIREALLNSLPSDPSAFEAVAICGTVPPGAGEGIYNDILDRFKPRVSVVDAVQGLRPESLAKATCLKLNQSEYEKLAKGIGAGGTGDALFLLTSGGDEALVVRQGSVLARLAPPRLDSVTNPIGAGDTVTAGVVHHMLGGLDATEAFRHGLAMGSASCLERLPAEYREDEVERLLTLTKVLQ